MAASRPSRANESVLSSKLKSHAKAKPKKTTFLRVENPFAKPCEEASCNGRCEPVRKMENSDSKDIKGNESSENAQPDLGEEEEYNGFYILRCKNLGTSQDELRQNLEIALWTLSEMFREYPTLPANPINPMEHMDEARNDATALLLPRKHCAFKGCDWNGSDEQDLLKHIHDTHLAALQPGMEAFRALKLVHRKDEATLALSIYNEGIATAVRQGAPLASYSIDRRCILEYNTHLMHENTGASVCFVCARKFPRVHGVKNNPIRFYSLVSKSTEHLLLPDSEKVSKAKDNIVF